VNSYADEKKSKNLGCLKFRSPRKLYQQNGGVSASLLISNRATRKMDELVELQKQERKTVRNRAFRRKKGIQVVEPKLSGAMYNLQKDGVNKIVYEGLFQNEQDKRTKVKNFKGLAIGALAGPESTSLTAGSVPMKMDRSEIEKYMRLREQNPEWNKYSTTAESFELKAELMKQLNKGSKTTDNCDWFNSQESSEPSTKDRTTEQPTESSSCESSLEEGMSFKNKLSKIREGLKHGKVKGEKRVKMKEVDLEVERERRKKEDREKVNQDIKIQAMAELRGVSIHQIRKEMEEEQMCKQKDEQMEEIKENDKVENNAEETPQVEEKIDEKIDEKIGEKSKTNQSVEDKVEEKQKVKENIKDEPKTEEMSIKKSKKVTRRPKSPIKQIKKIKKVKKVKRSSKKIDESVDRHSESVRLEESHSEIKSESSHKPSQVTKKQKPKKKSKKKEKTSKSTARKSLDNSVKPKPKSKKPKKLKKTKSNTSKASNPPSESSTALKNPFLQDTSVVSRKRPVKAAHLNAIQKRKKHSETSSVVRTSQSSKVTTDNEEDVEKKRHQRREKLKRQRDNEEQKQRKREAKLGSKL
jgi:hypothetical protein